MYYLDIIGRQFWLRSNVKYTVVFLYPGALFWVRWRAETQYKYLGRHFKIHANPFPPWLCDRVIAYMILIDII